MAVTLGIDALIRDRFAPLQGKRVGLLTNPSGVNHALTSTADILHGADSVNLVALFGPEHGVFAVEADGAAVADGVDGRTGLPAYSLYGDNVRPTADMLDGIDVLLVDIQDVGVRFYTYIWTLSYVLEACGAHGTSVRVLDRPNPLGGDVVRGPMLDPRYNTMVGRVPMPVQHGMTLGEFAGWFNAEHNPTPAALSVVRMEGWRRAMRWADTGLVWVTTSPAMPALTTVAHYPGACFIEGTTLSEGRGTALPFEVVGAPHVDGFALAERLNRAGLDGVRFRPHPFVPNASKHAGERCFGVQAHITDPLTYDPLRAWIHVLATVWDMQPNAVDWHAAHFDRLIGDPTARESIERGEVDTLLARWTAEAAAFDVARQPYLLY